MRGRPSTWTGGWSRRGTGWRWPGDGAATSRGPWKCWRRLAGNPAYPRDLKREQASARGKSSAGKKGFSAKGALHGNLYEDRTEATQAEKVLRRLKDSISAGPQSLHIDGVLQQLLDKQSFQRLVFPGLSPDQRAHAPASFQDLLETPLYANELEAVAVPQAMAKAKSVLENAKRKGAAQGETMDAQTEAMLWPQVVNEALARSIVDMVRKLHMHQHRAVAANPRNIASVDAEEATWEQLDASVVEALGNGGAGFAWQDGFMGEDWPAVIQEDVARLIRRDGMQPVPVAERGTPGAFGDVLWILQSEELAADFPALGELLTNTAALPHELNARLPPPPALTKAVPGATALFRLNPGCHQPPRVDCGLGENDTGYRVSGLYFLPPPSPGLDSGGLRVYPPQQPSGTDAAGLGEPVDIQPTADRLVLWNSRSVGVERIKNDAQEPVLVLAFWMHGGAGAA